MGEMTRRGFLETLVRGTVAVAAGSALLSTLEACGDKNAPSKHAKRATYERKVFIYDQDFEGGPVRDAATQTMDYWMPHLFEFEPETTKVEVPYTKIVKGKHGKKKRVQATKTIVRETGRATYHRTVGRATLDSVVTKAAEQELKLMPMVSAFDAGAIRAILGNPEEYARTIATSIKNIKAAGVAVDLESTRVGAKESAALVRFMSALRSELPQGQYEIAIATSPRFKDANGNDSAAEGYPHHAFYDFAALAPHVDFVHIMCYDFHRGVKNPMPVMPSDKLNEVIAYAKATLPKEKTVILLPLYGGAWAKHTTTHKNKKTKKKTVSTSYTPLSEPLSARNTDGYIAGHKLTAPKTYDNGELRIETKDRVIYAQDPHTFDMRLDTLAQEGITHVGGWRLGHGSVGIYERIKRWREGRK